MKRDELFDVKEPPNGGLARLRQRLDERPRVFRWPIAVGLAAAIALLLLLVRARRDIPDLVAEASARGEASSIGLGLAPVPRSAVILEPSTMTAMVEVTTSDPKVAFYWVSSTAWASEP
jgi:hypothetical protein